jgi:L-ascorbate 6-phosphate lactonase
MKAVEMWWLGQSGFRLRQENGPEVYIDPFLSGKESRVWEAPVGAQELARAQLILCTHEHIDHFDKPAIKEAQARDGARFTLVLPRPLEKEATELGLPAERVVGAQPGEEIEVAGVKIHPVPAEHGVKVADAYNFGKEISDGQVRYLGFVVEMNGIRLYHAGDTTVYDGQVELLGRLAPHVSILPVNGRDFFRERENDIVGNMTPREALRLASEIGSEVLVPVHWEMFEHNRGFPEQLASELSSGDYGVSLLLLAKGARFWYSPARG